MQFQKHTQIENVVDKSGQPSSRYPGIAHVLLERESETVGLLIATNGKALVRVRVTLAPEDVPGLIPADAFPKARKLAGKYGVPQFTCEADVIRFVDGSTMPRPQLANTPFAPYREFLREIPDCSDYAELIQKGYVKLALSADLLTAVAKAYDAGAKLKGVTMLVPVHPDGLVNEPIITVSDVEPELPGIIMPMRVKP
jgi:hypothetical protein